MKYQWSLLLGVCLMPSAAGTAADAAPLAEARLTELEARYDALRLRTERELERLEDAIRVLRTSARAGIGSAAGAESRPSSALEPRSSPDSAVAALASPDRPLSVSGDFRLRYEHTTSAPGDNPARDRGVLRGRLGAEYRAGDHLSIGARIATGDPDDPNSTDTTLGSFTDDLQVSLDRAYVALEGRRNSVMAGKFANPLLGTDLVWDGDVNPQGVAARHRLYEDAAINLDLTGIYALVDEQSAGADSTMTGAQLDLGLPGGGAWSGRLAAGYYDYHIGSLTGADSGDVRGNLLNAAGDDYLSDFDLLDVVAEVSYAPPGRPWPLTLTADYVHNFGAAVAEDSGYAGMLAMGLAARPGDVRLSYGYSVAETDAVFAAFSHDNTTYATNYRQHSIGIDYVPMPGMLLNLTGYRYRRDEPLPGQDDDPVTRVRLNWSLEF